MKYIFHIHSSINSVIASAIIKEEGLSLSDVLFVCCRGVTSEFVDVKTVTLTDDIYLHPFCAPRKLFSFKFLANGKVINTIDSIIEDFCGEDCFQYYVPHSKNSFYSVFFTHTRCQQVHYLEDGLDAYLAWDDLKLRFPVKNHRARFLVDFFLSLVPGVGVSRVFLGGYMYRNLGAEPSVKYGLTAKSFPGFSNVQVVSSVVLESLQSYRLPNSNVILLDALVEQFVVSSQDFFGFIKWLAGALSNCKCVSIKFHPAQTKDLRASVLGLLSEKIVTVEVIPDSVSMELVLLGAKKLNIFGVGSSLLNYASMEPSHNVNAYYKYFSEVLNINHVRVDMWNTIFLKNKHVNVELPIV